MSFFGGDKNLNSYSTFVRYSLTISLIILFLLFGQNTMAQIVEDRTQTLVVAYPRQKVSFDPLHTFSITEAQLFTAVYEGLVAYDPITLNPIAGQAERWTISPDRTVYTFYLRSDASFSNGDTLRAEDFRASWLRIIDPSVAAEYSFLFDVIEGVEEYRSGVVSDLGQVGIKTLSEKVLEVKLAQPADHFLKVIAHHSFSAIHPSYIGAINWGRNTNMIGNGPFQVSSWENNKLLLKRNEHYWGRNQVEIDRVEIRFYENPEKATESFMNGDIHWANTWSNTNKIIPYLVSNPLFATMYFYFCSDCKPFDDERVRHGLALLLPWDSIRDNTDIFPPSDSLVPEIADYPKVVGIHDFDERRGQKLLAQSGYLNGRGLPPIKIKVAQGSIAVRVARLMKESWEKHLEVEVLVQKFHYPELQAEIHQGDFALSHQTWVGDFADPLTFLQMWTRSSNLNDARYSNRDYDRQVRRALRATSKERLDLLASAEEMLLGEAVVLPISHTIAFNLVDRGRLEGWYPNALDIHPFRFIRFQRIQGQPGIAISYSSMQHG